MKKLSWVMLFSLSFTSIFPQWTNPVSITDSLSDNRNAVLHNVSHNWPYTFFLFWEKSFDSLSTDIYYMDFYNQNLPAPAVNEGNYHYRNPRVMQPDNLPGDISFLLLYETDQNGNNDIYYKKFIDGQFSNAIPLAMKAADDNSLDCNNDGMIVWENDSCIYTAYFETSGGFSPAALIDSLNCCNPVISEMTQWPDLCYIAWEKQTNGISDIYYSAWDEPTAGWSAPVQLTNDGNNTAVSFANGLPSYVDENYLFWEKEINGEHYIYGYDLIYGDNFTSEFFQTYDFSPSVSMYIVLSENFWDYGFLTFIWKDVQTDIFAGYGLSSTFNSYYNLTNSTLIETNPHIFLGDVVDDDRYFVNIWETFVNGHWQLRYSEISTSISGINSRKISDNQCMVLYQDPVNRILKIETCNNNQKQNFYIYSLKGDLTQQGILGNNEKVHSFDVSNLPPGIYILVVKGKNYSCQTKFILK